ncbi:hypothetical protein LOTGIDRAFT_170810 [Lottia gigantea]|uniref:Uncharacterized protein n=1 Tax=Lottia gigantea TaxID=225164 RepID=V4B2V2_LOTGI|nr:hypothetical protein LOTGIDRAFT_170810 [Lottia gigantea]ESP04418.1 hypothetical protein LOTGIDRAFT_170810 [Lottia gigantea]
MRSRRFPPEPTEFDKKFLELDNLKKEVSQHLGRLNNMRVRYTDWFERRKQTFMDSIKIIQVYSPIKMPKITSMGNLLTIIHLAERIPKRKLSKEWISPTIQEFLMFWSEICDLKVIGDEIYNKVCVYCDSITRLRDPYLKTKVDNLHTQLTVSCCEEFYFMDVHDERHNLGFYSISSQDFQFQGLMGFIPYLLRLSTQICYWSTKLYLEKE